MSGKEKVRCRYCIWMEADLLDPKDVGRCLYPLKKGERWMNFEAKRTCEGYEEKIQ